jgi:amino acid transporter
MILVFTTRLPPHKRPWINWETFWVWMGCLAFLAAFWSAVIFGVMKLLRILH